MMKPLRTYIYITVGVIALFGIIALIVWLRVVPAQVQQTYTKTPDSKSAFIQELKSSPVSDTVNQDKEKFIEQLKKEQAANKGKPDTSAQDKADFLKTLGH